MVEANRPMTRDAEPTFTRTPLNYSASADGYAEYWSPVIRPLARRLLDALPWDRASRVEKNPRRKSSEAAPPATPPPPAPDAAK